MEVSNKSTYFNKVSIGYVVNTETGDDPIQKQRVQVYIPEIQGADDDMIGKYKEYASATGSKSSSNLFPKFPWAYNTISDLKVNDIVYLINLSNRLDYFVILGRDASCNSSGGMGGGDGALDAAGLAELVIPFTIEHEVSPHYHDASCYNSKYPIVSKHDPLYECTGWADNVPDICLGCYTTSTSSSWSVGILNWDAGRAYNLIFEIAQKDSNWKSYFTDKSQLFVKYLEEDVAKGSTTTFHISQGRTSEMSVINGIQAMLTSKIGKEVQIATARRDTTNYIQGFMDEGITNPAILIYMADLCNQWGTGQPAKQPYLGAMHSAAKDPSSILQSESKQVEAAIKNYDNANQMMKEVEALHSYWMNTLHSQYGMNTYSNRRNECIAYIRELFKQGKLSQFGAGMTMLGNLLQYSYNGITLAYPFETDGIDENYSFSGNAWNGTSAYVYTCTMPVPKGFGISSLFGARKLGIHRHTGVDFTASRGTVLYASHDGTLRITDLGGSSYGYHAVISFQNGADNWEVYYGHMITGSSVQYGWSTGQSYQVKAGQPIGQLDSTGNSTGDHLHYELRRNGNFVNPLPYMGLGNEHYPILSGMSNYLLE